MSHRNGSIIATGEIGDGPAIHVWNSRTLESLNVIKGLHTYGVHLLAFTNDDSMIVSCGLTQPSACIVYDWNSGEIVISTALERPTQEIFVLPQILSRGVDPDLGKLAVEMGEN